MTEMYVHPNGGDTTSGTSGEASSVATATMEKVADEAADLRENAGQELGGVVDTVKDQASTLGDEAKARFKGEADNAATRVAGALSGTASELTAMAQSVDDPGPAAQVVRRAGARVDDVATRLERDGYEGVVRDVSRWARQNPGLFLLAAAGTGFVLGRVFRSVDPKSVADAARGNGSSGADAATQPALPAGAREPESVAGIGTMSPAPGAAPAVAPQPHPEAAVPVVDLSDPVDAGLGGPGSGAPGGRP